MGNDVSTGRELATIPPDLVAKVKQRTTEIVQLATEIKSIDGSNEHAAVDVLVFVADAIKEIEDARTAKTKPLNEDLRSINNLARELREPLESARKHLELLLESWQKRQRDAAAAARKAAEDAEAARLAQQAAVDWTNTSPGEILPPAPLPEPVLADVAMPRKTTRSYLGSATVGSEWTFEIVDEKLLPRTWLMPNEKAIGAAVRGGVRLIEGVRIFERSKTSVRRG